MSNFDLFLFDADDTLFDFGASEISAFQKTLKNYDIEFSDALYKTYKEESEKLWRLLELGQTSKDHLRVERFKRTFDIHKININPENVSDNYLSLLPESVHLNEYAVEICDYLSPLGDIGIVTNGIESVQKRRLENSPLKDKIKFMVVSEVCGHAKPDSRFFEHTMKIANRSSKEGVLVIGDRIETDMLGASQFGLSSCWYNPKKIYSKEKYMTYEISCLSELKSIVGTDSEAH